MSWLDGIIDSMAMNLKAKFQETVEDKEAWHEAWHVAVYGVAELDTT